MTKLQRREIYWELYTVLGDHQPNWADFMCVILSELDECYIIKRYPELHKQDPKKRGTHGGWQWGNEKYGTKAFFKLRQKALLKAIALTYK